MILIFTAALVFLSLLPAVVSEGYTLGGTDAECWRRDRTTKVQVQLDRCPSTIELKWSDAGKNEFTAGEIQTFAYELTTTLTVVKDASHNDITHANLHSCRTTLGVCIPNVAVSAGLVTQNAVSHGNFTYDASLKHVAFIETLSLVEGAWTVVAHTRFNTATDTFDVALGARKTVIPPITYLTIGSNAKAGLIFLSALSCFICLVSFLIVVINRNRKVIRFSTSSFCMIMNLGCALGAAAAIPYATVSDASCSLRPIMLMIAFTMAFIPLLLKTYRVFRIFGGKKLSNVKITDTQLSIVFLGFLLIDVIVLACWLTLARPVPTLTASDLALYTYEYKCAAPYSTDFVTAVIVYKGCLLLLGLTLAYLARNAPSLFNETRYIVATLQSFVMIVVIGIPLSSLIKGQPVVIYAIQTIVICCASLTVLQIFVPKYYLLYTISDDDIQGFGSPTTSKDKVKPSHKTNNSSPSASYAAPSEVVEGSFTKLLTTKEFKAFINDGIIPEKMSKVLCEIQEESDRLVKKSGTGFKVLPRDLKILGTFIYICIYIYMYI
jgi:hypothetical protein